MNFTSTITLAALFLSSILLLGCGSGKKANETTSDQKSLNTPLNGNYIYNLEECDQSDEIIKANPDPETKLRITNTECVHEELIKDDCWFTQKGLVRNLTGTQLMFDFKSASVSDSCSNEIKEDVSKYQGKNGSFDYTFSNGILRLTLKPEEDQASFCDAWIKQ